MNVTEQEWTSAIENGTFHREKVPLTEENSHRTINKCN